MALTQADLDALDAAIAKGEQSVSFGDRTVTYRSVSEMLRARAAIAQQLARSATSPRPRQYRGYSDKGL